MNENRVTYFWCKTCILTLLAVVSFTICSCGTGNQALAQGYVVVDDSIFENYFKDSYLHEELSFISKTDFSNLEINLQKKKSILNPVAFIIEEKSFAVSGTFPEDDLTKYYKINSKVFFPSIPSDFKQTESLSSPNLMISLTDGENFPEGNRALPVDGKYAGDGDYKLEERTFARCSILFPSFASKVFGVCDEAFKEKLANEGPVVFISSVGDMMVARGMQEILIEEEKGLEKVFNETLPILQNNDITIGNLEGVVTESNENATKTYVFKFHKEVLPELKKAGFNYFMQTNNHCYDYGEQGFMDTLAALKEYDIPTSGAGLNYDEAKKFYHKTVNGKTFAIISCGAYPVERSGFDGARMATATENRAGILWYNDELFENIKKEKDLGNFVIVNVHGGDEYSKTPSKKQRELYERFVDSGADVVFGSHPHVLQPNEWYRGKLIVYSMGNFLFNQMENMASYGALETEVVRLGISDGKVVYTEIYPARISGTSVDLVH